MTWPVAAASTTMRSQSARPSSDSRSSQQILPTVRISLTPGAAVATKSNARRHGSDATEHGYPCLHLEVLAQRRLGVHLHREHARVHLARLEADRRVLEQVGEVVLGVDLDEQDLLALVGGEECGGRGDGALADTALAREEEQPAVEQAGHGWEIGGGRPATGRTRRACWRRLRRPRCRRSARRGSRPGAP